MIGHSVSATTGRLQAGEAGALLTPHAIRGTSKYPIIACHGMGSSWDQWFNSGNPRMNKLIRYAADSGIPSIAEHLGGDTFGNAVGKARVTAALTAIASATSCSSAKAHLLGVSGGASLALTWAIANPTKVASLTLLIPAVSLVNMYNADTGGYRAAIGTAWGVTYPTPLPAEANLLANSSALIGIPTKMYYAPDDPLIAPADVIAMSNAIGLSSEAIATQGGGHNDVGMLPTNFNFEGWVNWLKGYGG